MTALLLLIQLIIVISYRPNYQNSKGLRQNNSSCRGPLLFGALC